MTDLNTDPTMDPTTEPEDPTDGQIDDALNAMQKAIDDRPVIVGIVLDRSGSMASVASATISGYNEFKGEQVKQPGRVLWSLTMFDTDFDLVHDLVPLDQVPDLTTSTFVPRGMTALYDGIGVTVASIDKSIKGLTESPARVVLVIMTDGGENSSKEHTQAQINELIEAKRKSKDQPWDIIFLGANQDAFSAGAQVGVTRDAVSNYAGTYAGTASALKGVSNYVSRSRSFAAGGQSVSNYLTEEDRTIISGDTKDSETSK